MPTFANPSSVASLREPRDARAPGAARPPRRSAWSAIADALRGALDRAIVRSSPIPDEAVLDVRLFAWTELLRANWQAIRDEARSADLSGHPVPVSGGHGRFPITAALIERIPGVERAAFSALPAATHSAGRRGPTKGLVTCHLGLTVPRDGDVRMRIDGRVVRWAEGETLVFDDTRPHELWNDATGPRVILTIRFARPLRHRWLARLVGIAVRERKGFSPRA